MTQTTEQRIAQLISENYQIHGMRADDETAKIVARELDKRQAEIDALTAQMAAQDAALVDMPKLAALLAEARAEVERLRPAAEAWEAQAEWMAATCYTHTSAELDTLAHRWMDTSARAREARK